MEKNRHFDHEGSSIYLLSLILVLLKSRIKKSL